MIAVSFYDGTHKQMREWSQEFCQRYPRYSWLHLCKAIEVCGFQEVNAQNIEHVKSALEARAASKQPAQP